MKSTTSIFDHRATTQRQLPRAIACAELRVPCEQTAGDEPILHVLLAQAAPGETTFVAFQRKEQAIAQLFAALPPPEARALHRRLCRTTTADALTAAFGRMVIERQRRLLAVLADAPRRAAIANARRPQ